MKKPKPSKKTVKSYDYHECRDYLEEKYKYDERDYAGRNNYHARILKEVNDKYGDSWYTIVPKDMTPEQTEAYNLYNELLNKQPEYLDFWHWVVDRYEIHNGCYITFSKETYNEIEKEWVKTIYGYYLKEFAGDNDEVTFYVWW